MKAIPSASAPASSTATFATAPRLGLNRNTLRTLTTSDLQQVAGGRSSHRSTNQ